MSFQASVHSALSSVGRFAAFTEAKGALIQKQEQAKKKVEEVKEAKKTQRRNFMEYLRKQETSLGGTVGDLPPEVQKQIARLYGTLEELQKTAQIAADVAEALIEDRRRAIEVYED